MRNVRTVIKNGPAQLQKSVLGGVR